MKKKISEIKLDKVLLRSLGDIRSLADSIKEHGLLQPIVINQNRELIAGRRRLEAAKMLGWTEIEVNVVSTEDDYDHLAKSLVENVQRKQLTWQEEVRFVQELHQLMQARYGSAIKGQRTDLLGEDERPWTSGDTAQLLKKGGGRVREEIILAQNLDEYPELEDAKTKTEAIRRLRKIKQIERLSKTKKPKGTYDVINVVPQWKYPGNDGITVEEIKKIELPLEENALVFLWTTVGYLPAALDVLRAWGLEYKNLITWKKSIGGLGHWGRVVTEHCLMGVKGKPIANFDKISNYIEGSKSEHGGKPDKFYNMISEACLGCKLDIFGVEKREGWDLRTSLE